MAIEATGMLTPCRLYYLLIGLCLVLGGCSSGNSGGGSPPALNTNIPIPPPAMTLESLANFSATNGGTAMPGGIGRVSNVLIDNKYAIVSIASSEGIASLLANPDTSELLTSTADFEFDSSQRRITRDTVNAPFRDFMPGTRGLLGVTKRVFPSGTGMDSNRTTDLRIYIDRRAPVVLAHRLRPSGELQFIAIGELAPANLPRGTASYSGYSAIARARMDDPRHGIFDMDVNFNTGRVTRFSADYSTEGSLTMDATGGRPIIPYLTIDRDTGTFSGDINFGEGNSLQSQRLIENAHTGKIHGQFHSNDAQGVTGVFHNNIAGNDRLMGGFAGAKVSQ